MREKFPIAAAGWLGVALGELREPEKYPCGEVFKSFIISTAVMMMDSVIRDLLVILTMKLRGIPKYDTSRE